MKDGTSLSACHTHWGGLSRIQGEQKQDGIHPGRSRRRTTEGRKREAVAPLRRGPNSLSGQARWTSCAAAGAWKLGRRGALFPEG
ncbi:hypothetical protein T01_366 [Trichinella spiralis]|uniref:Uncharacterized protein n=1 Tax=Trichinella spiralis TaxID=6334 RepID=A0A0V1C0L8_TRISP|nr:hypothetical protein T01_366 [Trichinella spiralis]